MRESGLPQAHRHARRRAFYARDRLDRFGDHRPERVDIWCGDLDDHVVWARYRADVENLSAVPIAGHLDELLGDRLGLADMSLNQNVGFY